MLLGSRSNKCRNTKRGLTALAQAGCSKSHILQVPVSFFFEGAPHASGHAGGMGEAPSPAYVADFLATSDGLSLTKAFMRIKSSKLRRRIVDLVEQIAGIN
jgi:hypothetical protein